MPRGIVGFSAQYPGQVRKNYRQRFWQVSRRDLARRVRARDGVHHYCSSILERPAKGEFFNNRRPGIRSNGSTTVTADLISAS
jgi:hypothetical protein